MFVLTVTELAVVFCQTLDSLTKVLLVKSAQTSEQLQICPVQGRHSSRPRKGGCFLETQTQGLYRRSPPFPLPVALTKPSWRSVCSTWRSSWRAARPAKPWKSFSQRGEAPFFFQRLVILTLCGAQLRTWCRLCWPHDEGCAGLEWRSLKWSAGRRLEKPTSSRHCRPETTFLVAGCPAVVLVGHAATGHGRPTFACEPVCCVGSKAVLRQRRSLHLTTADSVN